MVALTRLASSVELEQVVPGRCAAAIAHGIDGWRCAVARVSEFDDRQLHASMVENAEAGDD